MNYIKPNMEIISNLAEGIYAASGSAGATCYTADAYIHQTPEEGRENYCIQVNARHADTHTCSKQQLTLSFSVPVQYVSSNGTLVAGNGTNTIVIEYDYWNNPSDNIGLGDVYVSTDAPSLAISGCVLTHIAD